MINDPKTGALGAFDFQHLLEHVPELSQMNVEISIHSFEMPLDSSEVQPNDWKQMAQIVIDNYEKYDGFVILHGTDTMAYSASALSFMLQGIEKPIIFTGSQLPIGVIRTDAKENLITAIEVAAAKDISGNALIQEVAIYFEYSLYRGNRTSKVSAHYFEAFRSPNLPELLVAGVTIDYQNVPKKPQTELHFYTDVDNHVALLKIFPGINFALYKNMFDFPEVRGIILETFGNGNGPSDALFSHYLTQFIEKGGVVVNVTQCSSGSVEQGKYETSSLFKKAGVIGGYDLTTEAAVTKLMFALARFKNKSEVEAFMQKNICGEMTV
jgi:L-asparaginase